MNKQYNWEELSQKGGFTLRKTNFRVIEECINLEYKLVIDGTRLCYFWQTFGAFKVVHNIKITIPGYRTVAVLQIFPTRFGHNCGSGSLERMLFGSFAGRWSVEKQRNVYNENGFHSYRRNVRKFFTEMITARQPGKVILTRRACYTPFEYVESVSLFVGNCEWKQKNY